MPQETPGSISEGSFEFFEKFVEKLPNETQKIAGGSPERIYVEISGKMSKKYMDRDTF